MTFSSYKQVPGFVGVFECEKGFFWCDETWEPSDYHMTPESAWAEMADYCKRALGVTISR